MPYLVIATIKLPGADVRKFAAVTEIDAIEKAQSLYSQGMNVMITDGEGKSLEHLNAYVDPDCRGR